MRARLTILIFLLVGASVSLDLGFLRAVDNKLGSKDTQELTQTAVMALALGQTNLATLCFGLCSLPIVLRLGWIATICALLAWLFSQPTSGIGGQLSYATVIASLSLIASWLLKFAGYVLLVPGDELQDFANHEPPYRFTLSKLFGLMSIVAIGLFVIRQAVRGAVVPVGLVMPSFLISTILAMWSLLSVEVRVRRFAITLSFQVAVLAIYLIFGPPHLGAMWAIYCALSFVYALVLRPMGMRLQRLPAYSDVTPTV